MRQPRAGSYPPAYKPLGSRFEQAIDREWDAIEEAEDEAVRQVTGSHFIGFDAALPGRKTKS